MWNLITYLTFFDQLCPVLSFEDQSTPPLRLNIDGTAGTGKSYLIWAITKCLTELAQWHNKSSPAIRVAPTGIAAFNISGGTLHQTFAIPINGFHKLKSQQLIQLQTTSMALSICDSGWKKHDWSKYVWYVWTSTARGISRVQWDVWKTLRGFATTSPCQLLSSIPYDQTIRQ